MLKRKITMLMSFALALAVNTAGAADMDSATKNVVVHGKADEGTVSIILRDTASGEVAYIAEADVTDGEYFTKFKFPVQNAGDYTLSVKAGSADVTSGVLTASVHSSKFEGKVSLFGTGTNQYFTQGDTVRLKSELKNLYADEEIYNLYLACYDNAGKLIEVTKSDDIAVGYGYDGEVQSGTFEDITVPQNTSFVKVFSWNEEQTPLVKAKELSSGEKMYQDGDIVSFAGDSITDIGLYPYFIEHYYQTRYPERTIEFYNKGISGQTAGDVYNRLDWDIYSEGTDRMTLMIGINDIYYKCGTAEEDATINSCLANYRKVIEKCRQNDVEITLVTPPLYDTNAELSTDAGQGEALNEGLTKLSNGIKSLAAEYEIAVYDINTMSNDITDYGNSIGQSTVIMSSDRVHPTDTGYTILGYCYLKQMGADANVASVTIDGENIQQDNCVVSDVVSGENSVSFTYAPKSSPIAVNTNYNNAEKFVPTLTDDLNKEMITVKGLAEGTYTVTLDGTALNGVYTASDLAEGINIAKLSANPNQARSKQAYEKLMSKDDVVDKLRKIALTKAYSTGYDIDTDEGYAAFLAANASHGYIAAFKGYKGYKAKEAERKAEVEQYTQEAAELSKPVSYTISIAAN